MRFPPHSCASTTRPVSRASAAPDAARLLGLAAACALAVSPALADTVYLKGGRTIRADECHQVGTELQCSRAGGTVGIPIEQVERIEKQPRPIVRQAPPSPPLEPVPQPIPGTPGSPAVPEAQARIDALLASLERPGTDVTSARREAALLYAYLGNVAMLGSDYEGADARYRSALDQDPTLLVARLNRASALINLSRHATAEEILRDVLSGDPDNARALFLLGESAFQTGRLDEAIVLWEKSIVRNPSPSLAERLEKARRLRNAEEGFRRSDAAHFALKFDGEQASTELADQILDYLETSYGHLAGRLAHFPEGVIQVTLYSQRTFHEATESPSWVGGLFDGQLRIPIGGVTSLNPPLQRVLLHELTHCFVASKTRGNAPQWIQEGYAQLMEGKSAARDSRAMWQASQALGEPAYGAEFTYPKALSQVEYFMATWSESHFLDLLDQLGRGTDIDGALRAVTGVPYAEFLRGWADWLGR